MKYAVVFAKTGFGYKAHVPDLPGCVAEGETLDDTRRKIAEAVRYRVGGLREDGDSLPEATTVADYVDVSQELLAS